MRKKQDLVLAEDTIADRLLRLRILTGLTQEELCERIGYTSNYYGQAERGAIPLSRKLAESLRDFYNTTYEYLYFGTNSSRIMETSDYYSRNMLYRFLESCSEEECEALYQIAQVVIRSFRNRKDTPAANVKAAPAPEVPAKKAKKKNRYGRVDKILNDMK